MNENQDNSWTLVVTPHRNWFQLNLLQIWKYRDLLFLFFKRDIVTTYKQTILGPLWFVIQPILTTLIFTVIFGNIAKMSTDGMPPVLFYLSGVIIWNYFADCIRNTSDSFKKNENIFGKVYFPRIIVPLSTILSNLVKFSIQLLLFLGILFYFYISGLEVTISYYILLLPVLIFVTGILSLGVGMILSSLTTKYRDLNFLIGFGIQLAMYATPVIYPLSEAPEKYHVFILTNPMSAVIETFRFIFLGTGSFDIGNLFYSLVLSIFIFFFGLIIFNKTEKTFMDTV